jgi:hypothetical protein
LELGRFLGTRPLKSPANEQVLSPSTCGAAQGDADDNQETLDKAEFYETWERGKKLSVDEAVAPSLGEVEPDT